MPSNNILANKNLANDLDIKQGGFSMVSMSQTGPRMKRNMDGDDLPAPVEIYSRMGAPPPNNMGYQRSGISETQSEFNSGIQSLNARASGGAENTRQQPVTQ